MRALVINGPNLNMLGKRNKEHYGSLTLKEINHLIVNSFSNVSFTFFQSNHEGDIIDRLQKIDEYDFLLINPGAFAHYSYAIRDAFELVKIKKGVCHLSDILKREDFRKTDLLKDLSDIYVAGLKEKSYIVAIEKLIKLIKGEIKND